MVKKIVCIIQARMNSKRLPGKVMKNIEGSPLIYWVIKSVISIKLYDQIIAKGVSSIGCMAVNDPHVMKAWGDVSGVDGKIDMLSDSDCSISKSLGLDMDFGKVLGHRSKRFAMIVDNKVITHLFIEEVGAFEVSTAENILKSL